MATQQDASKGASAAPVPIDPTGLLAPERWSRLVRVLGESQAKDFAEKERPWVEKRAEVHKKREDNIRAEKSKKRPPGEKPEYDDDGKYIYWPPWDREEDPTGINMPDNQVNIASIVWLSDINAALYVQMWDHAENAKYPSNYPPSSAKRKKVEGFSGTKLLVLGSSPDQQYFPSIEAKYAQWDNTNPPNYYVVFPFSSGTMTMGPKDNDGNYTAYDMGDWKIVYKIEFGMGDLDDADPDMGDIRSRVPDSSSFNFYSVVFKVASSGQFVSPDAYDMYPSQLSGVPSNYYDQVGELFSKYIADVHSKDIQGLAAWSSYDASVSRPFVPTSHTLAVNTNGRKDPEDQITFLALTNNRVRSYNDELKVPDMRLSKKYGVVAVSPTVFWDEYLLAKGTGLLYDINTITYPRMKEYNLHGSNPTLDFSLVFGYDSSQVDSFYNWGPGTIGNSYTKKFGDDVTSDSYHNMKAECYYHSTNTITIDPGWGNDAVSSIAIEGEIDVDNYITDDNGYAVSPDPGMDFFYSYHWYFSLTMASFDAGKINWSISDYGDWETAMPDSGSTRGKQIMDGISSEMETVKSNLKALYNSLKGSLGDAQQFVLPPATRFLYKDPRVDGWGTFFVKMSYDDSQ